MSEQNSNDKVDPMSPEELIEVNRLEIDDIDQQMIVLANRRAEISRQIVQLRRDMGGTTRDGGREVVIIDRYTEGLGTPGRKMAALVLEMGRGPMPRSTAELVSDRVPAKREGRIIGAHRRAYL